MATGKDQPEATEVIEQAPVKKTYFSKAQSSALFVGTIITSVFAAIILTLLLLPFLLRVNPVDLYSGKAFKRETQKTIIKTTGESSSVAAVAKKVTPSVVNIQIKKISAGFFEQQTQEGVGSGVIFRKDGYILTNNHVVEDAQDILVTIGEDTNIKGTVVGADSESDIAVVKIDKNNLPSAELDRTRPEVGQLAVAIGSPFGFEHTVTSGIISAVNRAFDVPEEDLSQKTFTNLIQTDAAINPGNSGGALANAEGKVIGINTLIASQSGGSEGIGFAIPIKTAMTVADQLMKFGKASHPYLGVLGRDVTKELAEQENLRVEEGALVEEISPGSPAAKANMRPKDVVVKIDAKEIANMEDLISFIRQKKVGDAVTITAYRGPEKKSFKVTLAEKPRSK